VEADVKAVREALESDDKSRVEAASTQLAQSMMKMGEEIYKTQQSSGAPSPESTPQSTAASSDAPQSEILDADFEDISDNKK
jgi:hypothetical protein